ncbi:MAG: serine/threonine protein kinase, partial [Bdellovibrionales bacterium]|nr:serine/threonine protein kinase [Bdellovibrionales bacterium]
GGFRPTGEYIQLNSYENRVFEIFLEEAGNGVTRLITKFYRPHRWSKEAIQEEHDFLEELKINDISVVAPMRFNRESVFDFNGLWGCVFPKAYGRMPQEFFLDELEQVGGLLARLHNVGIQKSARYRPRLFDADYCESMVMELKDWVAPEVYGRYQKACHEIIDCLSDRLEGISLQRIHGDCHRGNILMNDPPPGSEFRKELFFVDFDDFVEGPIIQDFWMLLSSQTDFQEELDALINGYERFREFPDEQVALVSPLRGLRIFKYAYWIASRWQDPTFVKLFPDFKEYIYWAEEVEALESIAWSL